MLPKETALFHYIFLYENRLEKRLYCWLFRLFFCIINRKNRYWKAVADIQQNDEIQQLKKAVEEQQEMITALQKTVKNLQRDNTELEADNKNLLETVNLFRKKQFGHSSEKTKAKDTGDQLGIFNEAEAEYIETVTEPIKKTPKGHKKIDPKTNREKLIANLPIEELKCALPEEEQYCPQCGSKLLHLGREIVREEIQYIPAKVKIIRIVRNSYYCSNCKKSNHPYIKKAIAPSPVLNHSLASASSVANVMYQKYVNAMPLNRQEQEWERCGLALSRTTLANWVIRCAQDWLYPVYDLLHQKLTEREILHCDETPVQVLKEPGKAAESKSYMWLYRSGNVTVKPSVTYTMAKAF
jgi:transposase